MYRLKPGVKEDPARRWALPDRAFFGNGACHILAGVFLNAPPIPGFYAERVIPGDGYTGNHVYVTDGVIAFDYHGFSGRDRLLRHHTAAWAHIQPEGWNCAIEPVHFDLLSTGDLNARNMRGPDQYAGDPVSRAQRFIQRMDHHAGFERALQTLTNRT